MTQSLPNRPQRPSPVSLRDGRHVLLTLSWYYHEIHRGVARYASTHGWHVTSDLDEPVPRDWQGDGVITHLGSRDDLWKQLRRLQCPVVDLTESRPAIVVPRVTLDNRAIGTLAANYFVQRGYRNFAFVCRRGMGVDRRRRDVFTTALKQVGQRCAVLNWRRERGARADSRRRRHDWLVSRLADLPRPLAVWASRDDIAAEVLDACYDSGWAVPEQVSVLGVDNTEHVCECLQTPLSSIDPDLEGVGYEGAALLDRLMSGESPPPETIYVPPIGIVERASTDALAIEHSGVASALRYMRTSFHLPIGVPEIAAAVALSRSGLEKAFRQHFVRPPGEELRRLRVEAAKEMLLSTDHSVTQIAAACGLGTPQNLCRIFQQQMGETPRGFRIANRGK